MDREELEEDGNIPPVDISFIRVFIIGMYPIRLNRFIMVLIIPTIIVFLPPALI